VTAIGPANIVRPTIDESIAWIKLMDMKAQSENEPDMDADWNSEIERRNAELDLGDIHPIPWSEARRLIFDENDHS
jgi:hypothetical protein